MVKISAPKTKNVITWKIALDVLGELDEGVGDLVLGRPHRDPAHERGDQPVAERHVGEAERGEAEADRVDALVAAA